MLLRGTSILVCLFTALAVSSAFAQSKQYKRAKSQPKAAAAKAQGAKAKATAQPQGDKLDISDLEKKYWAPKDVDFSVVQNRAYSKEKRWAVTPMIGPVMNDPYNDGLNYGIQINYYKSERHGFEFQYISSDLSDSDEVDAFQGLSGGGTKPDFNRPLNYYAVGYNWVPIYAKMSVLGRKIIYFDLQITPHIGMSSYEQQANTGKKEKSTFTYGFDITQYYFLKKNFALRFNYHNRWSTQEVLAAQTGVKTRDDRDHTSMFLIGFTFFK